MNKKEIIRILISSIDSFKDINKYEMIGTIGSINFDTDFSGDLDLVSIGNNEIHKEFLKYLSNNFLKNNIKTKFFKTILKKPENKPHELLIHDLHYRSIEELLKNEWKTVINSINGNIVIFYGNNIFENIPRLEISKKDFSKIIIRWIKGINNLVAFKTFKQHTLKHFINDFYDYGFKEEGDKIKEIINSDSNYKDKLRRIKQILNFN